MTKIINYIGSKDKQLEFIAQALPPEAMGARWVVPFCGSLSTVLHFQPREAIVTDFNPEVINFWQAVRDDPKGLLEEARFLSKDAFRSKTALRNTYAAIRGETANPTCGLNALIASGDFGQSRAAHWWLVNLVGHRGLYRVNSSGYCNVPVDHTRINRGPNLFPSLSVLRQAASILSGYLIRCESWQKTLRRAVEGDFLYIDPPYDQTYDYSSSVAGSRAFDRSMQIRLFGRLVALVKQGHPALIHNNATKFMHRLYGRKRSLFQPWYIDRDHKIGYGVRLRNNAKEVMYATL